MNNKISIILFALFFSLNACVKEDIASGQILTEYRTVNEYNRLIVEGSLDVEIVQSQDFDIKVIAGENKMPYIKTKVTGNTLRIYESSNHVRGTSQDRIYISTDFLESITIDGSGDVTGSGLVAEDIDLTIEGSGDMDLVLDINDRAYCIIDGSGDMKITGTAEDLELNIEGSGSLDARYFPVDNAYIEIHGSGEARVHSFLLLDVHIYGSGDVYYLGSPITLNVDIQGSGGIGPL